VGGRRVPDLLASSRRNTANCPGSQTMPECRFNTPTAPVINGSLSQKTLLGGMHNSEGGVVTVTSRYTIRQHKNSNQQYIYSQQYIYIYSPSPVINVSLSLSLSLFLFLCITPPVGFFVLNTKSAKNSTGGPSFCFSDPSPAKNSLGCPPVGLHHCKEHKN
jgi:hypothetical protein